MNAMTGNYLSAQMKASDSDRDAVVSDLGEHFQAGRLTAGEFDERMGRALAARTWGELRDLLADLPAAQPGPRASATRSTRSPNARTSARTSARPGRSSGRCAPPPIAVLAGLAIAVAVLVNVAHVGWGFIWLLLPVLLVARRLIGYAGAPGHSGPED
jgi:Domain of unknown function (DUF1707)